MNPELGIFLSVENFPKWSKALFKRIIIFGDSAAAIINDTEHKFIAFHRDDMFLDNLGQKSSDRKYPTNETNSLTAEGMKYFRADQKDFDATMKEYSKNNDGLLSLILNSISPASETLLNNTPGYPAAIK